MNDNDNPTPAPTPEEIKSTAHTALEHLAALDMPAGAHGIYAALAVGAYHLAAQRALASHRYRGTATPRGLIAQLSADYPRAAGPLSGALSDLVAHAERGVDVGGALRGMWARAGIEAGGAGAGAEGEAGGAGAGAEGEAGGAGAEDVEREGDCADALPRGRARAARARAVLGASDTAPEREEGGAKRPDRRVRIAAASDPYRQGPALAALAERLRVELPPPVEHLAALTARDALRGGSVLGTGAARAAWLAWLDDIARAWPGPLTVGDLTRLAPDVPQSFLASIWAERVELLRAGIDEGSRRALALALLAEAEALGREALAVAQTATDERTKLAGLKLSLDTIARRASLAGLDGARLSVEVTAPAASPEQRLRAMGLDLAQLAALGDAASRALSVGAGRGGGGEGA